MLTPSELKRERRRQLRNLEKQLLTKALAEVLSKRAEEDPEFDAKNLVRTLIVCALERYFPDEPNILQSGTKENIEDTVRTLRGKLRTNLSLIRSLIGNRIEITTTSAFAPDPAPPMRTREEEDRMHRVIYLKDLEKGALMLSNEKLFGKGSNSGVKY